MKENLFSLQSQTRASVQKARAAIRQANAALEDATAALKALEELSDDDLAQVAGAGEKPSNDVIKLKTAITKEPR